MKFFFFSTSIGPRILVELVKGLDIVGRSRVLFLGDSNSGKTGKFYSF